MTSPTDAASAPQRPTAPSTAIVLTELASATDRLLATIDAMDAADFAAPSLLPSWSRSHVLAHLALNAKGLAGVLTTLGQDHPLTMYVSDARRDSDIEQLAAAEPAHVADRVAVGAAVLAQHLGAGPTPEEALEAVGGAGGPGRTESATETAAPSATGAPTASFARAVAEHADDIAAWAPSGTFERVPGAAPWSAAEIPLMRWREVEIHHADLGLGYTPRDWSPAFARYLYELAAYDRDGVIPMTLAATDGPSCRLGGTDADTSDAHPSPTVSGTMADVAFWLVGRPSGAGVVISGADALPALPPWVRRP